MKTGSSSFTRDPEESVRTSEKKSDSAVAAPARARAPAQLATCAPPPQRARELGDVVRSAEFASLMHLDEERNVFGATGAMPRSYVNALTPFALDEARFHRGIPSGYLPFYLLGSLSVAFLGLFVCWVRARALRVALPPTRNRNRGGWRGDIFFSHARGWLLLTPPPPLLSSLATARTTGRG